MAIKQITVFVENKKGTVVSVTDTLAKNNINLRALSIAETETFGILRMIVNDENAAEKTRGLVSHARKGGEKLLLALSDLIGSQPDQG